VFCTYCAAPLISPDSAFCAKCGKPTRGGSSPSSGNDWDSGNFFSFADDAPGERRPSRSFPERMNARLNAFGWYLNQRVNRVFKRPITRTRARVWLLISLGIVIVVLVSSLIDGANRRAFLGVPLSDALVFPFLFAFLFLLIYLSTLPAHWLKGLQILIWLCVLLFVLTLIWNILVVPGLIPPFSNALEVVIILVVALAFFPIQGFLFVLPAFYIWIRTRRPEGAR